MKKIIYLDNAATTPMHPEVLEAMTPYLTEYYGNPASIYSFAGKARAAVSRARQTIAELIHARPEEIYFTAGGSESDNWALKAVAEAYAGRGHHIITTKIEHHAVLHTCEYLEKRGFRVTYLDVDGEGFVDPVAVEEAICPDTILISVMMANNEIGTIEPVARIGSIAREHGVLFHTDAVQSFGHLPIDVDAMNIDLLSASGHKLNGPKGVGVLYVRTGVKLQSLIHGGAQERAKRAGTLNVPGIVGFGKAAELAAQTMEKRSEVERNLRNYLVERVLAEIQDSRLNGCAISKDACEQGAFAQETGLCDDWRRLPNNANFSFEGVEGETLLIMLDQRGICASSGSACTSGALEPSHVLTAMGLSEQTARGSLRITLSERNSKEEIDAVIASLKEIIERLRSMRLN